MDEVLAAQASVPRHSYSMMGRPERESVPEVPGPVRLECAAYWQEIVMETLPHEKNENHWLCGMPVFKRTP